jgi:DNA-binding transcriptional regulator YiaG
MAMRNFRDLLKALPAQRQERIEKRFQNAMAAVPLDQLREAQQMTHVQLAETLGVHQGEVTKIENQSDRPPEDHER